MLNPFATQYLSLFAYFILRFFVGGILVFLGLKHFSYRNELKHVFALSWFPFGLFTTLVFAAIEIIIGGMFIAGYYTQFAAIAGISISLTMLLIRNWFDHHTIPKKLFYILILGISLSLFITGAGAFAFDLPI